MKDHRQLGTEMDLFHVQEEAAGSVFWHPAGWRLFKNIEQYLTDHLVQANYQEIRTPQVYNYKLWEKSGHWGKFRENMFCIHEDSENPLGLKPMSCPGHIQVFNKSSRSYRDLPYRLAEYGLCHRNEPSGALNGLMRLRQFTQDDAHIFCTEDQIVSETRSFCDLLKVVYTDFGFSDVKIAFSTRPDVRAGSDEDWDRAESALKHAADEAGLGELVIQPGEGAFYGPKLEFVLTDSLGRDWQCGTLQVDFVLPKRLDARYANEAGDLVHPVMLHRAILGSFERFIAILLEHHQGKLPLFVAPTKMVICSLSEKTAEYTQSLADIFPGVECDISNNTLGAKIKQHLIKNIPLIGVVGPKEASDSLITIRKTGSKKQHTVRLEMISDVLDGTYELLED